MYIPENEYLEKIYRYLCLEHEFNGRVTGDFSTAALGIFNTYKREIEALRFVQTPPDVTGKYLAQYFIVKRERSHSYLALVENSTRGWREIFELEKRYGALRLRGRGLNRRARCEAAGVLYNSNRDLPIRLADKIAVYPR